ncbi:MAG: glycosyltransferase family 2 protein [Nitriliruptoraceae bacterium]
MSASDGERRPGLAVVLVTHDTRSEVLGAIGSLAVDPDRPAGIQLVVVDTGSSDGTAAAVREAAPEATVLRLVNTGFARAANAGIRATSAEVVVLANADVRFSAGAVARLATTLREDPRLAAVGPQVRFPDGARQASARRELSLATLVGHGLLGRLVPQNRWTGRYHARDLDPTLARDVAWLSGCAVALRRSAVVAIGGFDPGYFLYVEDVDLGERLRAAGWRLRYDPRAVVEHRVGASTSQARLRALRHHAESLHRYLAPRLHGPGRLLRPLLPLALTGWVIVTAVLERLMRNRSTTGERTR